MNDAAAHRAAIVIDEPSDCHVAQRSFRDKGDAPRNCARASAVQSTEANRNVVESCNIDQTTFGSPAHNKAVNAGLDPGSIAAFVDLIHLDALLEVEARFLAVTAIEQPKRLLQHDHAPTDDHHLAVTRMSQSAPRRKRAERAARKIESEMRSPPPTPRGPLSPLLSP